MVRRKERAQVVKRLRGIYFSSAGFSPGTLQTLKIANISEFGMGLCSNALLFGLQKGFEVDGKILIANTSVSVHAKLVHFTEDRVGFEFVNPPELVKDAIRLYFESEFIGAALQPVGLPELQGVSRFEDKKSNALEVKIGPDGKTSRITFRILGSIAEWNAFGGWRWLQDQQILPVTDYMKKQLIHLTRSAMALDPSMRDRVEKVVRNISESEAPRMTEPVMRPVYALPEFSKLQWVHIIGVGGTLMGAFAAFLRLRGIRVTGSDQTIYPPMSDVLLAAGVEVVSGYRAENIPNGPQRPDLIVIGNVIRSDNPEARAAMLSESPYASLPETMEQLLLQDTLNVVVAGTHGKTTTSSLLSYILSKSGKDPSYFIGGVCPDLPSSFNISAQEHQSIFVLEGDEYDTAFWDKVPKFNHYRPDHVLLTSIEYDHADIYPNLEAVLLAFNGLMKRIRPGGKLICCLDYSSVLTVSQLAQVPMLTYGSSIATNARFTASDLLVQDGLTHFSILDHGRKVDEITMQLGGRHNVLNALAAWIECGELGLSPDLVRSALRTFRGVKRRQELRGIVSGVSVIDDFAHHPTAVRETLHGLKLKYNSNRLIAVFEPRSATSRRKIFQEDYATAFFEADCIFIAQPYDQSQIKAEDQFSSEQLVQDLVAKKKDAHVFSDVKSVVVELVKMTHAGDIVVVFSNGGFGGLISLLLESLKSKG